MKNFNIELTYQPLNDTWSAVIHHGIWCFTQVNEDMLTAIEAVTEEFLRDYPPVCRTCGGSGEVRSMEQVYPGEPHMADVGTEPCPDCNVKNKDDE